jgi:propanol-preferring alcohol dehydrogenase
MENYCQQPGGPAAGGLGRRDGGMAEFLLVPAARYLISLGSLDPRDAAPLSDAALTSYHAINRSRQLLAPGSTAVVIGAGGLGQMAIQILRALSATTTIVAVHTGPDKLQTARQMGADEALVSGDEAIQRINDITTGQGAELVLDMVSVDRTLQMAAKVSRVLGHLTIVGLGGGALPVNFNSPRNECVVASPFWGWIPELVDVVNLAQTGKIRMLVEHVPVGTRRRGLSTPARRQDQGTRRHHTQRLGASHPMHPLTLTHPRRPQAPTHTLKLGIGDFDNANRRHESLGRGQDFQCFPSPLSSMPLSGRP